MHTQHFWHVSAPAEVVCTPLKPYRLIHRADEEAKTPMMHTSEPMVTLPTARVDIEIPFHDCDPLNIGHGHYCKYLEIARCALLKKIRYTYEDNRISGYAWPVIDVKIKYVQPLVYQQIIQVEAKITEWGAPP